MGRGAITLTLAGAYLLVPIGSFGVPLLLMEEMSSWLLDAAPFTPRVQCGTGWNASLVERSTLSEAVIFVSFNLLSAALIVWHQATRASLSLRESVAVGTWAIFTFACGLTHLMGRLMFVWPVYRLDAYVRCYCAVATVAAVISLAALRPPWTRTPPR